MFKQKIKQSAIQYSVLLILFLLILMIAFNQNWVKDDYFASEFSPMYYRGRAVLEDGLSPYAEEIQTRIQEEVYGEPILKDDAETELVEKADDEIEKDPFIFINGVPALILMFIPILIPDAKLAYAIWLAICELAIVGTIFLIVQLFPRKHRGMLTIYLVASLFFFPEVFIALKNGSLVILEMFFAWVSIYLIFNEKDELAGVFLGLLLGRALLFLPFTFVVLIWLFSKKRFSILKSYLMTTVLFLAISFVIDPQWVFALAYTILKAIDVYGLGIVSQLIEMMGIQSNIFAIIVSVIALSVLIIEFVLVLQRKRLSFIWFIVLGFTLMPFMGLPLNIADYYLLYPAIAIIFIGWYAKLGKKIRSYLYTITGFVSLVLWLLWAQDISIIWLQFTLLLLTIFQLYWIRWWIIKFEKQPQSKREKLSTYFKTKFKKDKNGEEINDFS